MKIKRPDWDEFNVDKSYSLNQLNDWFDEYIEPVNKMLGGGIEVYVGDSGIWTHDHDGVKTTKALLIDIKLIKRETAEDVLRELIYKGTPRTQHQKEIWERAKAVLEDK